MYKRTVKSKDYFFEATAWSFSGPSFESFMYNTDHSTYIPNRRGRIQFEQNTLYMLRHVYENRVRTTDTLRVKLDDQEVDSLYYLAYRYLSDFEIENEVEIGQLYETTTDGANFTVTLGFGGKRMECSQYRLKGVGYSSSGGPQLIEFINKKVPHEFELY